MPNFLTVAFCKWWDNQASFYLLQRCVKIVSLRTKIVLILSNFLFFSRFFSISISEKRQSFDQGNDPLDPEGQQPQGGRNFWHQFNQFGQGGFTFKFHFWNLCARMRSYVKKKKKKTQNLSTSNLVRNWGLFIILYLLRTIGLYTCTIVHRKEQARTSWFNFSLTILC